MDEKSAHEEKKKKTLLWTAGGLFIGGILLSTGGWLMLHLGLNIAGLCMIPTALIVSGFACKGKWVKVVIGVGIVALIAVGLLIAYFVVLAMAMSAWRPG